MTTDITAQLIDHPAKFLEMCISLIVGGRREMAFDIVETALAQRPDDAELRALSRAILSYKVPGFHFRMLQDFARNQAYRAAIERLVPGKRVLDIGTGSGLLAMMAARAGAESVIACEQHPFLAATARKIIAANGLSDKITVIAKNSSQLDREADLGGGVDCVVSEIFSDNLLSEGVLPALAHARRELCNPGAIFIPERANIRIALAEHNLPDLDLTNIEDFDLSHFNAHLPNGRSIDANSPGLELRSEAASLFDFAFLPDSDPPMSATNVIDLTSSGGTASGIAQWISLTFQPDILYENRPGIDETLGWPLRFVPITPRELTAGDTISISGLYQAYHLALWEAQN